MEVVVAISCIISLHRADNCDGVVDDGWVVDDVDQDGYEGCFDNCPVTKNANQLDHDEVPCWCFVSLLNYN